MAIGDDAVAAGMTLVTGTSPAASLDTFDNETRDYIARYAKRTGLLIDIWVQATAPAHKVGRVWIKTSS